MNQQGQVIVSLSCVLLLIDYQKFIECWTYLTELLANWGILLFWKVLREMLEQEPENDLQDQSAGGTGDDDELKIGPQPKCQKIAASK